MSASKACWPPQLTTEPETLGYLVDRNGCSYSRDIGRSFTLGGHTYYLYGDTFCKNTSGEFVGLVSNSYSIVPNVNHPLESCYLEIDDKGLVKPLLKLTDEEKAWNDANPGHRITLWPFSGVLPLENGKGLLWYERGIDHNVQGQGQRYEFVYMGLAEVTVVDADGTLSCTRGEERKPSNLETRLGSVSTMLHGDYVYLYGEIEDGSREVGLSRVRKDIDQPMALYEKWTDEGWTQRCDVRPKKLFANLPQGAIFHSNLFGPDRPFVFIGVSKFGDSKVQVGSAACPEGPWDIKSVCIVKGINHPGYMYCIYPHTWVGQDLAASLMVTWSEHWPGGVVAGKLSFQLENDNKDEL